MSAEAVEERLGGGSVLGQSVGVEVKLELKKSGSFKPVGGSVAIKSTAAKVDVEDALGKTASVGVSAGIAQGTTIEAPWG